MTGGARRKGQARAGAKATSKGRTLGKLDEVVLAAARRMADEKRRNDLSFTAAHGFDDRQFDDVRFDAKLDANHDAASRIVGAADWGFFVERLNDAARRCEGVDAHDDGDAPAAWASVLFFLPVTADALTLRTLLGDGEALDAAADDMVEHLVSAPVTRFVHGSLPLDFLTRARPGLLRALLRREVRRDDPDAVDAAVLDAFGGRPSASHRLVADALHDVTDCRVLVGFRTVIADDGDPAPTDDDLGLDFVMRSGRKERLSAWEGVLRARHGAGLTVGLPDSPGYTAIQGTIMRVTGEIERQRRTMGVADRDALVATFVHPAPEGTWFALQMPRDKVVGPFLLPAELLAVWSDPLLALCDRRVGASRRLFVDRESFEATILATRAGM